MPTAITSFTYETPLYRATKARLPQNFPAPLTPGSQLNFLHIPMVLPPNVDDIQPPFCSSSFYTTPRTYCVPNVFVAKSAKPLCRYQTNSGNWYSDEGCDSSDSWNYLIAIYYRDAWAAKIAETKCTFLGATTLGYDPPSGFAQLFTDYIHWFWFEEPKPPVVPGYTFAMGAVVPPMTSQVWSGKLFSACQEPGQ